ncbi:nucleotidyltransferase [Candidatus Symbiothrix dinenymphae]|nr:nucleotidyltransferase [Candidatus Symbiothrix dinenymphae]
MDKSEAINIARQYAQAVRTHYGSGRVFLFGSYAKGNYHEDSDIDLAVIFDDYENDFDRELELMRLRREIDLSIEPHAFRESEFTPQDPLAYEVLKYGSEII